MVDLYIGIGGIGFLLLSILFGAPIMVALTTVGFCGIILLKGIVPATAVLGTIFFSVVNGFHFSVIPMFLLMGFFAMSAGIGSDLFDAAHKWLGRLPGGLAVASTGAAAAFGAASGSSVGTATLFTRLALPEMIDRGYDRGFAAASIAIAGTLAVLIPPSALMVVYGILTDSGIGKLLIAGILPGAVFALLLVLTIIIIAKVSPEKAPAEDVRYTLREKLWSLRMVGPLIAVIAIMLGGLYGGVFTPSEAGGVGAFVTFVMAIIRRRGFRGLELGKILMETVTLTAMIFAIIVGGLLFARFLALSGASGAIRDLLVDGGLSTFVVVTIVTLVYLVLGTLMDAPSLLAISLPITYPVMIGLGYDPLWFGVYVVILAEIGAVTPPVGINCFVVKGAAGNLVTLEQIFGGLWPFLLAALAMLILMLVWPDMALLLPRNM
ncbi:TRAP transporter large permease [Puniceibacterium sp. IMCC21224]|uniref:TRAP transporter large permease n=1 Tax=Puniceibacterium sp. IMCC21224 TaxID=1618204 RepID=UPI00064D8669|nr:TRAP transporter large permease [Puniceibacterium sp. IMCC21224]KMK64932.1 TRAP transporter, DctM subunit [Puniceibacterium sp. IMCC21224]